jgi:hypothetical protein
VNSQAQHAIKHPTNTTQKQPKLQPKKKWRTKTLTHKQKIMGQSQALLFKGNL